jgi:OOP family OmpA-OmpF porin
VLATAIVAATGAWLASNVRERLQWNEYLDRLSAEPGIIVVSSGRRNGQFFVRGLRDPLARDPDTLLDPRLRSRSASRWELYETVDPLFVVARASRVLRPPDGVTLEYRDGTLVVLGPAPERWMVDSERLALTLPGISRFVHADEATDVPRQERVESSSIPGRVDR